MKDPERFILESTGLRTSVFDLTGNFVEWEKHKLPMLFKTGDLNISTAFEDPLRGTR